MQIPPTDFLERLTAGETPDAILTSLRPPSHRELVKRLAVVRAFDQELFESVLANDLPDVPPFEEVVQWGDVEALPRTSRHRLIQGARSASWQAWWEDPASDHASLPEPLRALMGALTHYYRSHESRLDLLAQLVLLDPTAAAALFDEMYTAADRRFDLAACQDLIDILSDPERAPLLDPQLIALRLDRAAYLRARSLWSAEYYQTATFLEPAGLRKRFAAFIGGSRGRVLNLHAPGGRGKTTQLRWLCARQLVPEPDVRQGEPMTDTRVPCVRVDFDVADPVNATRYPWLVLLEAAAQLNEQLPELPFNELLEADGWALPLLRRNPADPSRVEPASKRVMSEGPRLAGSVVLRFGRTLNEAAGDTTVLLVLDTLEEVHLRPQGNLEELVGMLNELLALCPRVQVILSGRHSVREVIGTAASRLQLIDQKVRPLSRTDAERYLEQRHIPAPSMRRAIAAKADGNPFILSLLGDICEASPDLSPAEVRRYPADVVYLILRVIRRIKEPGVRWLIRYGVVPRTLSLAFVREVMQPYLRQAMSSSGSLDDPIGDELSGLLDDAAQTFPRVLTSAEAPLDLDGLWAQLRRYSGSTSWVFPLPDEDEAVRFRSDVVVPMRRIVRTKEVFRRLHQDAAIYYERQADAAREDGQRWTRLMREAVYHRFQLDGPEGARTWHRALDEAGLAEPERREALASELLEPDYVDEEREPLPWSDGQPIVLPATLIEAQFERARALTELARARRVSARDQLWSAAEKALADIERRQRRRGRRVIPQSALGYVRAGLALKDDQLDEARKQLRGALRTASNDSDIARLRLLLADAEASGRDPTSSATYDEALVAGRRARAGAKWIAGVHRKRLESLLELDQYEEAAKRSASAVREVASPRLRRPLLALGLRAALCAGQLDRVDDAWRTARMELYPRDSAIVGVLVAHHRLEPARALERAQMAERDAARGSAIGSANSSARAAWARELIGLSSGGLMRFDDAIRAFEAARSIWKTEGDQDGILRCYTRSAALELRDIGDIKLAEHHLREADQQSYPAGSQGWVDPQLLWVELLERQGRPEAAVARARSLIERLRAARAAPRSLIRAAIAGLAVGSPDDRIALLRLLVDQCALVAPASARVALLNDLRRVPELREPATREPLQRLRRLLRIQTDKRLSAHDRGLLRMILADLDRIRGDHDAAAAELRAARTELDQSETPFFLRRWALTADRIELPGGEGPAIGEDDVGRFLEAFKRYPMLCGAFLVERAEAALLHDGAAAEHLLDLADDVMASAGEQPTQWHARLARARARILVGRVAERIGAEAESIATWTKRGLAVAAGLYRSLGDLRNAEGGTQASPAEPPLRLGRPALRTMIRAGRDGLDLTTTVPPGDQRAEAGHDQRLFRLLDAWVRQPGQDLSGSELEYLFAADPLGLGSELGSLLVPPSEWNALRARGTPLDLIIEVEDRRLNAVPWELARDPDDQQLLTRRPELETMSRVSSGALAARNAAQVVQVALNRLTDAPMELIVDGDFGPVTSQRLRDYQRQRQLEVDGILHEDVLTVMQADLGRRRTGPPLAVLVQPSAYRQYEGVRGSASVGVDQAGLYEEGGFSVLRLENPSLTELVAVIKRASAADDGLAVLHLSGGLRESGGEVVFTFMAGEWYSEALGGTRHSDLPVTALDHVVGSVPSDAFSPLVVLDIGRPPGLTECVNQLFLRNAFAGDLLALGRCPAILATGLAKESARSLYGTLIRALSSGATVGDATSKIRSIPISGDYTNGPESVLAIGGTALFTHVPWFRPFPR